MSKRPEDIAAKNGEDMLATRMDDICDFDDEFDLLDESAWFEQHLNPDPDQAVLEELIAAKIVKILQLLDSREPVNELSDVSDLLLTPDDDLSEEVKLDIHQSNDNKLSDLSRLLGREVQEDELLWSLAAELVEKELVSVIAETN